MSLTKVLMALSADWPLAKKSKCIWRFKKN